MQCSYACFFSGAAGATVVEEPLNSRPIMLCATALPAPNAIPSFTTWPNEGVVVPTDDKGFTTGSLFGGSKYGFTDVWLLRGISTISYYFCSKPS